MTRSGKRPNIEVPYENISIEEAEGIARSGIPVVADGNSEKAILLINETETREEGR